MTFHRGDLKYLLFMAVCEPCIYFVFEAKALQLTTASQAGLITSMLPLMVALGAFLVLKETISGKNHPGVFYRHWRSLHTQPQR